ncbi:MAG: hypothetical protein A2Y17_01960 [Clostridiales bacterium GWF2_38_85]|nr:MAG: hypothetical protein A2Y17_01960 [Clostridiales bacterium GWF2_38_85]HBL85336.1 8-oxo-dGTP diphosphatase MutT [Clostridiales bacterium]
MVKMDVSAAIIRNNNEILICQKPLGKYNALLWEFPGGKLEQGETAEQCIVRECFEELGVEIMVVGLFDEITHNYPEGTVHISFFDAGIVSGEITLCEHANAKWVTPEQLQQYEFCAADREVGEKLHIKSKDGIL